MNLFQRSLHGADVDLRRYKCDHDAQATRYSGLRARRDAVGLCWGLRVPNKGTLHNMRQVVLRMFDNRSGYWLYMTFRASIIDGALRLGSPR